MNVFDSNGKALSKAKIRICGFNVGLFSYGQDPTPAGTDAMYFQFVDTFRKCNADIYMFSEWRYKWNADELSEDVLGFISPYHSTFYRGKRDNYMELMTYSRFPFTEENYEWYTSSSVIRYFTDDTVVINGKTVHLICVHFTLDTKADAMDEMNDVITYIKNNNITSYIICGDMNLGLHAYDDIPQTIENRISIALEEIAILESLGGHSVQGSGWGPREYSHLFNTALHSAYYPPQGRGLGPFDNVVVSPDIAINNVEVVLTEASDHDALCVDLVI